nr:putative ribonuclease H-like domain-containing protein [Tanacetum cinerariifolium]
MDLGVGSKANINAEQAGKKTIPGPQYVLLPLLTSDSQGPKSLVDEVVDDAGKKREATNTNSTNRLNPVSSPVNVVSSSFTAMDPGRERAQRNEFESIFGQDKDANGNNIYRMFTPVSVVGSSYVNLDGSIPVNVATLLNVDLLTDPLMPNLEDIVDLQDIGIFSGAYDDEVEGAVADFNNFELTTVMDVKSAFLYDTIEEDVYVCQPPGFKDPNFPNKVYKVEKALYGLHQAPRAWYETLSTYLLKNRFRRGIIDKTLFIKKDKGDILLVQVYVDDIIFGSIKKFLCIKFEELMHKKFQMSSVGELTFFLGLQFMQRDDGIFISQYKFQVTPKVSHLHDVKRIFRYLKGQPKLGLWYLRYLPFDLEAFSDSDYAGASPDRKSTTREKPTEAEGFEQIIDFLNASYIKYALTVNPTVYTSCIEQFWATVNRKQKTRRKQRKEIKVPSPSSKIPNEEGVPTTSNYPLSNGDDKMQLNELMILCTNLQKQVLNLEKAKTAQAVKISSLKMRVKKLERKKKSRTSCLKRLRKVGSATRVEFSAEEASLGDQEDASKQGRKIDDIDQDVEITSVDETQGRMNEEEMFRVNDLDGDEVIMDATAGENVKQGAKVAEKEVSTTDPVTTAGEVVTTAGVEVTTAATTLQISKD